MGRGPKGQTMVTDREGRIEAVGPPGVPPRRSRRAIAWLIGTGLGVVVAGTGAWAFLRPSGDPSPGVLEASGRIEGDQAAVGAKIGGRIVHLPLREGAILEAGQVIALLSSEQAAAQLQQAGHDLHTAREQLTQAQARVGALQREVEAGLTAIRLAEQESRARIGEAEAALGTARARLLQAEAERERAEKDHVRYRELLADGAIAPQVVDQARAAFQGAKAAEEAAKQQVAQAEETLSLVRTTVLAIELRRKEVEQVRERLREAGAGVEVARARIQSAEAGRALARANVSDTQVRAPFAGTVLRKLVAQGEVVAAGTPLITFVDLSRLHVKVYLPEGEIGKVKLGQPARVYVDAFPQRFFEATISEVSQQAEFTPRDIHMKDERVKLVFAVKLALQNPEGLLKPGMPADARIRWRAEGPWGDGLE